jgi:hypothetical protein
MRLPWRRGGTDVARRLRSVDAATRRSFVAALWAARGWETRVEGQRVVARDHPEWADSTLLVPDDGRVPESVPTGVDVVVTTRTDAPAVAARIVAPADLHRLAMYAVDRDVGERLVRSHLDVRLAADDSTPTVARRLDAAVLGVVVVLVLAAVMGAAGSSTGSEKRAGSATPTASPALESTRSPQGERSEDDSRVAVGNLLAPGLSNEGVVDARALADAHADAVDDRSYVWLIAYIEYRNRSRAAWPATRTESVVVRNDTRYLSQSGGWGALEGTPYVVSDVDAYGDGSYRYSRKRVDGETRYERIPMFGRTLSGGERGTARIYAARAGRYVRWYASANETRVHDVVTLGNRSYYRVTLLGNDYPGTRNFSAVALVAPNGFVREIRASYDLPDSNRVAEVQLSYRRFTGPVERPDWYDDARNATRPVLGGAGAAGSGTNVTTTRYSHDHQPPRPPRRNVTDETRSAWAVPADYRLLRAHAHPDDQ